ncbi:eCIS core domain-containing protein [Streptomyces decoyicus]
MRAHDRRPESGRDHAGTAPAARATVPTTPEVARRQAVTGEAGHLTPEAAAVLQRAVGNAAFSAALAADEQHRHGAGCGHTTPPAVQRSPVEDVLRTPGRSLDDSVRADMESRLGADFSDVRVHTDAAAHESAESVNAHAYTSGAHIVFQRGRYDGSSAAGRHMLAHELTHVIQQRTGPVAGTDRGDGTRVSDPSDRFEREAEANASRVMSGTAPVQRSTEPGPGPSKAAGSAESVSPVAGHGAYVQRVEAAASLAGQLAEPCADMAIQQRIEAYDALTDQRPQQRLELLGEIAELLHKHSDREQLKHIEGAVEGEMHRQSARLARLRRYTADEDGPYELMTDEGLLWDAPDFAHRTSALGRTGQSYFAELSSRNLRSMQSENRDRGQKKNLFSKEKSEPAWMEPVRQKLRQALMGAELHHYTPASRARAMLTDGGLRAKTQLELDTPGFEHNTSSYDEAGLANTGFVFFFIESPGAVRGTRFAKGSDDADAPACVHLPLQQSGLLSSGWVMLSDFAQREYPQIWSTKENRADTDSSLPTRDLKEPAKYTEPVRKFELGVGGIEVEDIMAVAGRPEAEREAASIVTPQVRGDGESEQKYYDGGGKAVAYKERLFQNVLHGHDIIPGLTERAVMEIARFEQTNPKLADSLRGMSGEALMNYLLKHLLRPQAMMPNSVQITEENIAYNVST